MDKKELAEMVAQILSTMEPQVKGSDYKPTEPGPEPRPTEHGPGDFVPDITELDLRNSFPGLILPSVASVFYIYLLKENFSQIPDELYYAAKVDGTSDLKYLFKVMIPICRPTLVTVTILKVIECWNSYVWPRLITDDPNFFLVSVGIQEIRENGLGRENIPAMMAAVVVISVQLILLFLIFRKKIMEGVSRGGVKG